MPTNEDNIRRAAADIQRRTKDMLIGMTKHRDDLRKVQALLPEELFKEWAFAELGLDQATLQDILAFDGSMEHLTGRMMQWVLNSAARTARGARYS